MKRCKHCVWYEVYAEDGDFCTECVRRPRGENGTGECEWYVRKRWLWFAWWIPKILLLTLALLLAGCSPGRHHGHIYIHDPNHIEVIFDRPMSMSIDRDGVKVEASSMQPGFFEDIIKFLLLRPR